MCHLNHVSAPTIGFQQLSFVFEEGTSGQVCVTVDSSIEGPPLLALLAYIPLTASKFRMTQGNGWVNAKLKFWFMHEDACTDA